jgi:hypothetical protein
MVYFVSAREIHQFPVYPEFLDAPSDGAFNGVTYEQDPETLDLTVVEREFLAKGYTALEHGYRVAGNQLPKKVLWTGGNKAIPDFMRVQCIAVSLRLRDMIEKIEPGVHQFFPFDIYLKRDGEPVGTYYWLNVCNRIDSVNEQETTLVRKPDYAGKHFFWRNNGLDNQKLVFSSKKVAPYHLWIDPYITGLQYFHCSNAFAQAAEAANFLGLNFTQKEEA